MIGVLPEYNQKIAFHHKIYFPAGCLPARIPEKTGKVNMNKRRYKYILIFVFRQIKAGGKLP